MRIGISLTGLFLVAIAAIGQDVDRQTLDSDYARKRLPIESLAGRLPKGKPITPGKPLDAESRRRWEIFDRDMAAGQERRAGMLKALHEKTLKSFLERPGAGPRRFSGFLINDLLADQDEMFIIRDQPGKPADFPVLSEEPLNRVKPDEEFYFHHVRSLSYFLYPRGFGYVKDREHVVGFKSHGFRWPPVPMLPFGESRRWRINHVQLVGILYQEEPVVYLTDNLPSMEQVRQGKTRALDFFEADALPSLRDGEDLYIVSKDNTLRMLGAVRATRTCQKCHEAEVGDLLGAFSYTLRGAQKATKPEQ
jgi:hypothetical protein